MRPPRLLTCPLRLQARAFRRRAIASSPRMNCAGSVPNRPINWSSKKTGSSPINGLSSSIRTTHPRGRSGTSSASAAKRSCGAARSRRTPHAPIGIISIAIPTVRMRPKPKRGWTACRRRGVRRQAMCRFLSRCRPTTMTRRSVWSRCFRRMSLRRRLCSSCWLPCFFRRLRPGSSARRSGFNLLRHLRFALTVLGSGRHRSMSVRPVVVASAHPPASARPARRARVFVRPGLSARQVRLLFRLPAFAPLVVSARPAHRRFRLPAFVRLEGRQFHPLAFVSRVHRRFRPPVFVRLVRLLFRRQVPVRQGGQQFRRRVFGLPAHRRFRRSRRLLFVRPVRRRPFLRPVSGRVRRRPFLRLG